jgi:hypothetical protein
MRNEHEHKLQVSICKWLDFTQDFYYYAIPNGGARHRLVAIKLKMEGVKAGVADMFWMLSNKNWNGLFIEVKIEKGTQQINQKAFEQIALAHGYYYAIVKSIDDCENLIKKFKANEI